MATPLVAVLAVVTSTVRETMVTTTFDRLDSVADIALAHPPEDHSDDGLSAWVVTLAKPDAERRVTLVTREGKVLADSHNDPVVMDNHADRPEIAAAFREGYGRSQRFSATRGEALTYVAVRPAWRSDRVVRFSAPVVLIEETTRSILTPVVLIALLVVGLAAAASFGYAGRFSERIAAISRFSERVASGDLRPADIPPRKDGLDELVASLNRAAARLQKSITSLTNERNRGRAILSSMGEGVAVMDPGLRIRYLNASFRQLLQLPGGSWKDFAGRKAKRTIPARQLVRMAQKALKGERSEVEVSLAGREILARAAPVRSSLPGTATAEQAEAPLGAVLVLTDVTELHRLERVRRDFVANLSHELKTPLTSIQGFAETLMGGGVEDGDQQRRFLGRIHEHAVRLSRTTDDLLKLARMEGGKQQPALRPVDVGDVIQSVLDSTNVKSGNRALTWRKGPGVGPIRTDPDLLAEILHNLVDNAVQYSADDGRIEIEAAVADDGDLLCISVTDDGAGIPEKHRERIFERFYRVDQARSRAAGGTGLGLAIAKHAAELLSGRLQVESAPERGSRFSLFLPRGGD